VNVFFRVNEMRAAPHAREFMIGSIGLADSAGILAAALLAMPVELGLCAAQVARGRTLCREL
jgi:battenin